MKHSILFSLVTVMLVVGCGPHPKPTSLPNGYHYSLSDVGSGIQRFTLRLRSGDESRIILDALVEDNIIVTFSPTVEKWSTPQFWDGFTESSVPGPPLCLWASGNVTAQDPADTPIQLEEFVKREQALTTESRVFVNMEVPIPLETFLAFLARTTPIAGAGMHIQPLSAKERESNKKLNRTP